MQRFTVTLFILLALASWVWADIAPGPIVPVPSTGSRLPPHIDDYLFEMLCGYVLSVVLETAVLVPALSPVHPIRRRILAGAWLTACSYPLLWLVLPLLIDPYAHRTAFLLVGETLVVVVECALFWAAFHRGYHLPAHVRWRDYMAIVAANLVSFGVGKLIGGI